MLVAFCVMRIPFVFACDCCCVLFEIINDGACCVFCCGFSFVFVLCRCIVCDVLFDLSRVCVCVLLMCCFV